MRAYKVPKVKGNMNKGFAKALKPIKDNVQFPSEGKNKIWSESIPEKFRRGKLSQKWND